jgi:hypothetical protein
MITITKEAHLEGDNPAIFLPGIPEGDYQIIVVLQPRPKGKRRQAGFSKAQFVTSHDFNAPLDDFKEYMQ